MINDMGCDFSFSFAKGESDLWSWKGKEHLPLLLCVVYNNGKYRLKTGTTLGNLVLFLRCLVFFRVELEKRLS